MVVKSATKKKLMDMLVPEEYAHLLADDRKWDDVKILTALEISATCKIDSETAGKIHGLIVSAAQGAGKDTSGDGSVVPPWSVAAPAVSGSRSSRFLTTTMSSARC